MTDDLEVLARGRILSPMDFAIQREQEVLLEYLRGLIASTVTTHPSDRVAT